MQRRHRMGLARALAGHGGNFAGTSRACMAARQERRARVVRCTADNTKRCHDPVLGDPVAAQAHMERQRAEPYLSERFDWLHRYDARSGAM